MIFSKMIATCGGIGNIKGGGTIAAACYTILWLLVRPPIINMPVQVVLFITLVVVGVWVADKLETIWGKDSSKIVIDEVAGMCGTLLFVPHQWQYAIIGLAAFRWFDITKPLFIRAAEKLPGGWGVMADDVAAGICANLLVQLVVATNLI